MVLKMSKLWAFGVEGGEERAILEALERNPANARHPRECAVGTTGAGATS